MIFKRARDAWNIVFESLDLQSYVNLSIRNNKTTVIAS